MLELVNVTKTFSEQGAFCVLKDINIQVQPGKFVCILGPSGCGKTILLYLIAGFIKPTTGKISLNKQENYIESGVSFLKDIKRGKALPLQALWDTIDN